MIVYHTLGASRAHSPWPPAHAARLVLDSRYPRISREANKRERTRQPSQGSPAVGTQAFPLLYQEHLVPVFLPVPSRKSAGAFRTLMYSRARSAHSDSRQEIPAGRTPLRTCETRHHL